MPNIKRYLAEARELNGSEEVFAVGRDAEQSCVAPHRRSPAAWGRRWGVILAGGDGTRLQRLTRLVSGDDRPKQFCALVGEQTLLEQTRLRAERSIGQEQILVPLTRTHAEFYIQEAGIRPAQRIVQPSNKGTAPPIVCSLLSIEENDSEAIVAILPCDHHYSDDRGFTAVLESAFALAENTGSVVLLGAPPRGPETEYGWIELGPPAGGDRNIASFTVRGFCEKPSSHLARQLFERNSLWNTFVMVGHVRGFLDLVRAARPDLVKAFSGHRLWDGAETQIADSLYDRIESVDFSREILSNQAGRLVALRMDFVGWNDLGRPERVIDVLRSSGLTPSWMKEWAGCSTAVAVPLSSAAVA